MAIPLETQLFSAARKVVLHRFKPSGSVYLSLSSEKVTAEFPSSWLGSPAHRLLAVTECIAAMRPVDFYTSDGNKND